MHFLNLGVKGLIKINIIFKLAACLEHGCCNVIFVGFLQLPQFLVAGILSSHCLKQQSIVYLQKKKRKKEID